MSANATRGETLTNGLAQGNLRNQRAVSWSPHFVDSRFVLGVRRVDGIRAFGLWRQRWRFSIECNDGAFDYLPLARIFNRNNTVGPQTEFFYFPVAESRSASIPDF